MVSVSQAFDSEHPLLTDRKRLDGITDVMYAKIQKTLFFRSSVARRTAREERILEGSGDSENDVLSQALADLLQYSPENLKETWEGLAVRIAHRRAIDALRASKKGLRGTEHRPQLRLVSGDAVREGPGGTSEPPLFEVIPGDSEDPEAEYSELESALVLRDLARDVLDERAREIFFAIHFECCGRAEVGERLGLTSQRIGQIYRSAAQRLYDHPNCPFKLDK